jgi:hypothetical protein
MKHAFCIPWRDRGLDPLRQANIRYVTDYLTDLCLGEVHVFSDGREGKAPFNRSMAYNHAVTMIDADIFTFCESDMIVPKVQLEEAISLASGQARLVVPFYTYYYLSASDSMMIRDDKLDYRYCEPESVMVDGRSVGAVNTMSRLAIEKVGGYDEQFEGSWYDDRAMAIAFEICCGPTLFVDGPAWHLYHIPGWEGAHLTQQDREATNRNKARLKLYRRAHTPERIRELTAGGK